MILLKNMPRFCSGVQKKAGMADHYTGTMLQWTDISTLTVQYGMT